VYKYDVVRVSEEEDENTQRVRSSSSGGGSSSSSGSSLQEKFARIGNIVSLRDALNAVSLFVCIENLS
jgi:hypothetical protein